MAGEAELLRMLEPAVRPAGTPAHPAPPRPPVEQQPFDELLRQAEAARRQAGFAAIAKTAEASHAESDFELYRPVSDREAAPTSPQDDFAAHETDSRADDSAELLRRLGQQATWASRFLGQGAADGEAGVNRTDDRGVDHPAADEAGRRSNLI
jgi:hypothetical protein